MHYDPPTDGRTDQQMDGHSCNNLFKNKNRKNAESALREKYTSQNDFQNLMHIAVTAFKV